jgi:alkanesulfonate monooxygenase SsuD/methylene tetrahydromethanopterin reductase-like flavin-dependent oxidoreductase (luciferase family)
MILGVGLGWPPKEFKAFGEESDIQIRAEKTDESLEILQGLWSGDALSFKGNHYTVDDFKLHPTPVQKPRVPIWVAGMWPKKKPFRRAAQFEGVVPLGTRVPSTFAEMKEYTEKYRTGKGEYAWVCSLTHPPKTKRDQLIPEFKHFGANWYLESWGTVPFEKQFNRTKRGPPDI